MGSPAQRALNEGTHRYRLINQRLWKILVPVILGFINNMAVIYVSVVLGPPTDSPAEEESVQTQPEADWRGGEAYQPSS